MVDDINSSDLPERRTDKKVERRDGKDRRSGIERRYKKRFRFRERRCGMDRRSGEERRYGVDRRLFDAYSSKKRAENKLEKKKDFISYRETGLQKTKLEKEEPYETYEINLFEEGFHDIIDINKTAILDDNKEICAYTYFSNLDSTRDIFIEAVSEKESFSFESFTGDVQIISSNGKVTPSGIKMHQDKRITFITEKSNAILINQNSCGFLRIGSKGMLGTSREKGKDLSSMGVIITIAFSEIERDIAFISENSFRFGKMRLEIDLSYTIEIIDLDDVHERKIRITGPAGLKNLKAFLSDDS